MGVRAPNCLRIGIACAPYRESAAISLKTRALAMAGRLHLCALRCAIRQPHRGSPTWRPTAFCPARPSAARSASMRTAVKACGGCRSTTVTRRTLLLSHGLQECGAQYRIEERSGLRLRRRVRDAVAESRGCSCPERGQPPRSARQRRQISAQQYGPSAEEREAVRRRNAMVQRIMIEF